MSETFQYELKPNRDRPYFIKVRATPSVHNPQEFAVTVFYKDADSGQNTEIARIDTSHGYAHFDKLFRRDQPKEEVDLDLWEAVQQLRNNWQTYAEMYEKEVKDS